MSLSPLTAYGAELAELVLRGDPQAVLQHRDAGLVFVVPVHGGVGGNGQVGQRRGERHPGVTGAAVAPAAGEAASGEKSGENGGLTPSPSGRTALRQTGKREAELHCAPITCGVEPTASASLCAPPS